MYSLCTGTGVYFELDRNLLKPEILMPLDVATFLMAAKADGKLDPVTKYQRINFESLCKSLVGL